MGHVQRDAGPSRTATPARSPATTITGPTRTWISRPSLGLNAYRFSIGWPRIVPDGTGAVNQKGLDFYRRQVDGLRARGLEPMATLYHWDLPQPLQDAGGWVNRDTVAHFCDYVQLVLDSLADVVPVWVTMNEAFCSGMIGHLGPATRPAWLTCTPPSPLPTTCCSPTAWPWA